MRNTPSARGSAQKSGFMGPNEYLGHSVLRHVAYLRTLQSVPRGTVADIFSQERES